LAFSIRTNFAIMGNLSVVAKVRRALGFRRAARVVTQTMMDEFTRLASLPDREDRLTALDDWLLKYGHRGPFESDPYQPRFSELRQSLRASVSEGPAPSLPVRPGGSAFWATVGRPFFLLDEYREWFRDEIMRWWGRLRDRILTEAQQGVAQGHLED